MGFKTYVLKSAGLPAIRNEWQRRRVLDERRICDFVAMISATGQINGRITSKIMIFLRNVNAFRTERGPPFGYPGWWWESPYPLHKTKLIKHCGYKVEIKTTRTINKNTCENDKQRFCLKASYPLRLYFLTCSRISVWNLKFI